MHASLPIALLIGGVLMAPHPTQQPAGGRPVPTIHTDRSDAPFTLPPQKPFTVSLKKSDSSHNLFAPRFLFGRHRSSAQPLPGQLEEAHIVIEEPKVVCGMTLFPADPSYDAKIRINPTADSTRFTIKRLSPSICK